MTTGNYAAVMLIAYTGMRAREVTALRWSDVDFERKRIMVMRTAIETAGGYSFSQNEGKESPRHHDSGRRHRRISANPTGTEV